MANVYGQLGAVKPNLAGIEDEALAARWRAQVEPAGRAGMMPPKPGDRSVVAQETPGTTAPLVSETVPVIEPRSVWANVAIADSTGQIATIDERTFMASIPLSQ